MFSDTILPPSLILIFGAVLLPAVSLKLRNALILILPASTLIYIWLVPIGDHVSIQFLGYTLNPLSASVAGRLFATIFALHATMAGLYAIKHAGTMELTAALIYAGAAIGVTFCGDLISLFIYWEMMAIASTTIIWSVKSETARKAGMRYLLVHLFGGVLLMTGIVGHILQTGSAQFTLMNIDNIPNILILSGFLINAGAPPLSGWIADAYPEASPSGMVFLSAFTTKTSVYTLLVGFAGTQILIYIGLYMIFYGIIYALLENNYRRILAYSIVNQVGFMVVAIGIGSQMAVNGAAAHAFAHVIYKGLLLMSAGSVLLMTGKKKCSEVGGLFQSMPVTAFTGIIGALSISAFPFTSGFISKSLTTTAAADAGLVVVWLLLIAGSAGVFLHAGIKFPWYVFFQKDSGLRPDEPAKNLQYAMWIFSFFCIGLGIFPNFLYAILPYPVDFVPYTADHLISQFQLLLFSGCAFFVLLPLMKRTHTISLDFDWFYRRFIFIAAENSTMFCRYAMHILDIPFRVQLAQRLAQRIYNLYGPEGIWARTWTSSDMVLWLSIIFAILLFTSYLM